MWTNTLTEGGTLPLVVEPDGPEEAGADSLLRWTDEQRARLDRELLERGGVLFRGFSLGTPRQLEAFTALFGADLKKYVGGDSPRTALTERIYTSTEYPSHLHIPHHHEMSYASEWPDRLFFLCSEAAEQGGETPLADGRRVLRAIDPVIRERWREKGVCYVRNLHGGWGMGKSWQETFETTARDEVERHCRDAGIEFSWNDDTLSLRERRAAIVSHARTGDRVWFNQAHLWHVSSLGERKQRAMLKMMGEDELPQHALHGDGSPIDPADLDAVRAAYAGVEIVFPWRRGDLLLLDNVLVAHGRRPFKGSRRLLTAMA